MFLLITEILDVEYKIWIQQSDSLVNAPIIFLIIILYPQTSDTLEVRENAQK